MKKVSSKLIQVWAHWEVFADPQLMGILACIPGRGKEIFSFEYESSWLENGRTKNLDPSLQLYAGPQYAPIDQDNFGLFLDSAPDRWGRLLMRRREVRSAKKEGRKTRDLKESDYLLGVYDGHRLGGLRFKTEAHGPFLDDNAFMASPPWTSLRDLEYASLQLEKDGAEADPDYSKWLELLIAPGASLGGARPKASIVDPQGHLWIAKFPSRNDAENMGAWEAVVHKLAQQSGIKTAEAQARKFSKEHHTFMTKRFDRNKDGGRIHFASAMTLLKRNDGDDASTGTSYLELAQLLMTAGACASADLEQLWRRIVFFICVSNTDDHLRNHGFLLTPEGWVLSPCYDMNPSQEAHGLKLNISENDNSQDLDLALQVAALFRVKNERAQEIVKEVVRVVKKWRTVATGFDLSASEQNRMSSAFSVAEAWGI